MRKSLSKVSSGKEESRTAKPSVYALRSSSTSTAIAHCTPWGCLRVYVHDYKDCSGLGVKGSLKLPYFVGVVIGCKKVKLKFTYTLRSRVLRE